MNIEDHARRAMIGHALHGKLLQGHVERQYRVMAGLAVLSAQFPNDPSASLLTESLRGKTREEALKLFDRFQGLVTGNADGDIGSSLGKLTVFSGVCEFPARVKCATLVWHTLRAALEQREEIASTE